MRTLEEIKADISALNVKLKEFDVPFHEGILTWVEYEKASKPLCQQLRVLYTEERSVKRAIREASGIEDKFKAAVAETQAEIQLHITAAVESYNQAKKLAEKHGIPFETPIVMLSDYKSHGMSGIDTYVPKSVKKKWPGIHDTDEDTGDSILGEMFEVNYDRLEGMQGNWFPSSLRC